MEKNKQPKKKVKWVYRSSPLALKILLAVLIVLAILALAALRQVHLAIREYTEEVRQEVSDLEYNNQELQDRVDNPDSAQNIMDVAKEELDLVDPNTIIIDSVTPATE